MNKVKFIFCCLVIFVCGGNTFVNLSGLFETNNAWMPAWWKLAVAIMIAIGFSAFAYSCDKE